MTDKLSELEELEKRRLELIEEIKKEEKEQHKTLVSFFRDSYPRGENKRPISLKKLRENYVLVEKGAAKRSPEDEKMIENYKTIFGVLRKTADNIDYSQGFAKLPNLSEFTKWVEKFKSKN